MSSINESTSNPEIVLPPDNKAQLPEDKVVNASKEALQKFPKAEDQPLAKNLTQMAQIVPRTMQSIEEYQQCNITREQSEVIYQALTKDSPLRTMLKGKKGADIFAKMSYRLPPKDMVLENGKTLFRGEQAAIALYTTDAYNLLNGVLASDSVQKKKFYDDQGIPPEKRLELEKEILQFVEAIASGLNKIPKTEKLLYRGDYYSLQHLESMKKGEFTEADARFKSASQDPSMCLPWAEDGARNAGSNFVPVIFMLEGKSASDIQKYSSCPDESESLYLPRQAFYCEGTEGKELQVASLKELVNNNKQAEGRNEKLTSALDMAKRTEGKGNIVKVEICGSRCIYMVKIKEVKGK